MGKKLLTRQEEVLLLAIWKLQQNAYGMSVKGHVEKVTDNPWSFGAVYAPLSRLLKKRFIASEKGEPTNERGGRSKVFYSLTDSGKKALLETLKVHEASWNNIPVIDIGE